jgi:hypothetical protein
VNFYEAKALEASPNVEFKTQVDKNVTEIKLRPKRSEDPFIGLAISGGGSRAAVFAASVMLQLERIGVLQHVQYISSADLLG